MISLLFSNLVTSYPKYNFRHFQPALRSFSIIEMISEIESEISPIVHNANMIRDNIANISQQCGKGNARLVCVSKTKPIENIQSLYDAGYRHFGENYFQELVEKAPLLPKDISWHFIGHLQSSKASKLIKDVPNLEMLETLDTIKLANKLNNACESVGKILNVLVQVDTSGEETKSGVSPGSELIELVSYITTKCNSLTLKGLMTIGAPDDPTCFDKLVSCRDEVSQLLGSNIENSEELELSMGMSSDYDVAITKGATSVRVGSVIFGPRIYPNKK